MAVKMYPQNSKIKTTDNDGNPRGIPVSALAGAFVALFLRMHTLPYVVLYALWCLLLSLWHEKEKQGELRLYILVPIRTGLGTRLLLLGSELVIAELWNFTAMNLGTMKILQVLLAFVCQQYLMRLDDKIGVKVI